MPGPVLVTGGAGFIGSHLVERLLEEGHEVHVVDDLSTGCLENLRAVRAHPRLHITVGSVLNYPMLNKVMGQVREALEGVDAVMHLAAESHVDRSIMGDTPFRTNVLGTQTMLAATLDARVRRFLHCSTDEVYGELPWRDPAAPGGGTSRRTPRSARAHPTRPPRPGRTISRSPTTVPTASTWRSRGARTTTGPTSFPRS